MSGPARDLWLDEPVPHLAAALAAVRAAFPGEEPPRYGSWVWRAMRPDDIRRTAAVYVAAEAWRRYDSTEATAERLREEMDAEDRRVVRRLRATSREVAMVLRESAPGWAGAPSYAQMKARRDQ